MTLATVARAKLNLELRVLGTLPDGRHRVETVLQSISLGDLVEVEPAPDPELVVTGLAIPAGPVNLALRAAAAVGVPARIRLLKRVPAGAGLGGGSADAAAVLRLLAGPAAARAAAPLLGADVPFLLRGGTCLATGAGETLEVLPDRRGWYAIAWPGFGVSTAAVYGAWDEVGGEGPNHLLRAALRVEPRLAGFTAQLGAGWRMTGSGSAFFQECGSQAEAEAAARRLTCWTAVARAIPAAT